MRNFFYVLTGYKGGGSSGIVNDLAGIGDAASGVEDLGSAGSDAAGGLGDAAKAAEELKNATLGIDELNIISPNEPASTSGSGGSGGGGAGGVGGTDLGLDEGLLDMGDTDPEKYVSPWAERIRAAFLAEDWEGLGAEIADGLNRGLQKVYDVISWENVGPKITAFTTAFTESFNSLADNFDWDLLGRTVGTGINTIVNTLNNLIDGIDWKNLGSKFAVGLNGLVGEVNWYELGRLIGNKFMIAWDTFLGFVTTLDFGAIGTAIADGINGFFSEFNFTDIVHGINEFVDGIWKLLFNAVTKIKWGKIFDEITDAIGNLELDTAFLLALPAIGKLQKALKNLKKSNFAQWVKDLSGNFKGFAKEVKDSGSLLNTLKSRVSKVTSQMTKLQKGLVGAVSVFAEFSLLKDAFNDIASGGENIVSSLAKIVVGAGAAATALKLIGLSNPLTAAITGVTALISAVVGVNSALEEQKKILEEQEEIERYGDTVANITQKTKESTDAIRERAEAAREYVENAGIAETAMAQSLADKYFDLAEKESLTNEEKEQMKNLAGALVDTMPQLEEYYNSQTGLLDTTRESVDKLIDSRLEEIRLSAVEEKLKEAYEQQIDALDQLQESLDNANEAKQTMNELEESYQDILDKQDLLSRYNDLTNQISYATGDVEELRQEQQELWDELTNGGTESIPTLEALAQDAADALTELEDFKEEYNNMMGNLKDSYLAYEDVEDNITKFTDMLTQGMTQAANNSAEGYSNALSENDSMANSAKQQAENILNAFAEAQDSHSPSKKFASLGEDSISGYILGINMSAPMAIVAMQALATKIASSFGEAIVSSMKKTASSIPTYFSSAWVGIATIFSVAPAYFTVTFTSAYNSIKTAFQFMDSWFREKWIATKNVFKDVNSYFKSGFQTAYNSVKNIWSGLGSFFKSVAKNAFAPIEKLINGIISGVNWVLKEVDSDTRLSEWNGVAFKRGSDGVPRNMMGVVNDQKGATYRELIVPPNGKAFIPKGRNVMMPLQKGTKIMPADETKEFLKGFSKLPHFAKGIGSLFGWNEKYSGDMFDYLDKPDAITKIALDKFVDVSGLSGLWRDMAKGIAGTTFDSISEFIGTIFEKIIPKVDYNPSAGVEQWRPLAKRALQMTGQYTEANLDRLLMQMQTESGGNPNAINDWDINAINGTPSKGLMQVIDPTFKSYAYPGYDKNIYDPLSNILAAIRYTLSRYGSLANGWKGHGYASGIGKINLSDLFGKIPALAGGGTLMPGQLFVANERGPELIGRYGNRTAVMNNDQVVESVSSGVEKAIQRQNDETNALLRQILDYQQRILAKKTSVDMDGKRTGRLIDRAKSNSGYNFRPAGGTV